jgi:hypothetical protein
MSLGCGSVPNRSESDSVHSDTAIDQMGREAHEIKACEVVARVESSQKLCGKEIRPNYTRDAANQRNAGKGRQGSRESGRNECSQH